ncbi:zinc finger protein [Arthroderma uncinatum]|uniref:zinc finger protein n=1 Tax=Arthroderma uncinatum TaxID=74035 RepID=UPI00144A8F70|nr:zinc finger protein [Arthroderma uncinatum]KAF3483254.1 zinc finger protein [Arthroderma uncinatum]
MAESPASPLSSLASEEFPEDVKFDDPGRSRSNSPPQVHPSKRRKTGISAWDHHTPISSVNDDLPPPSPVASISSDSSGAIPNSPGTMALLGPEEDYSGAGRDHITVCLWEGCGAKDFGNMDALVKHIHNEHIGSRQKKYLCEWGDCARKGQAHASGYALRAHMRSHTKEKPFYCALPECDRSFTRSDALSKHMRTVHDTDALKSLDALAKQQHPTTSTLPKPPRIKLKLPPRRENDNGEKQDWQEPKSDQGKAREPSDVPIFDSDIGFDEHELSMPLDRLARLIRRQIHWAEQESKTLERNWEIIKPQRKQTWKEKELILDDLIHGELRVYGTGPIPDRRPTSRGGVHNLSPMPATTEQMKTPSLEKANPEEVGGGEELHEQQAQPSEIKSHTDDDRL